MEEAAAASHVEKMEVKKKSVMLSAPVRDMNYLKGTVLS